MTVETLVVDFLNEHLDVIHAGIEAFMDVPETRPVSFITVERVGGPEGMFTGQPLLAVQAWAEYRFEAAELAVSVAQWLRGLAQEPWVGRVTVSGVTNFPDPDSGHARYQLTLEIVTKFD